MLKKQPPPTPRVKKHPPPLDAGDQLSRHQKRIMSKLGSRMIAVAADQPKPEKKKYRKLFKPRWGRPMEYDPEFHCKWAFKFSLLGMSSEEMAETFGLGAVSSLYDWMEKYPELQDAILRGKSPSDAEVAKSLYLRAKGFSREAVKIFCSKNGELTYAPYKEYFAPDTGAAKLWLSNRTRNSKRGIEWVDRAEIGGPGGGPIQTVNLHAQISPVDAAKTYAQLIAAQ